jgi:hypothetical protein
LKDVRWVSRDELMNLKFFPEIRQAILAAWDDGFKSNVEMVNTPWE